MAGNIGKIDFSIKTDLMKEISGKATTEVLDKEINGLFGRDNSLSKVPVKPGDMPKPKVTVEDIRQETSFLPRSVPKPKESGSQFVLSDKLAKSRTSEEYETHQEGHSVKGATQGISYDGSPVTKWEGVNQEKTTYVAEGKERGNTVEIQSRGKAGEFEGSARITREEDGTKKEALHIKNNKTGTESSYTIETKGNQEKHKGTVRDLEGNITSYELEKSRGKVMEESFRTDFAEGGIELRETVKEQEQIIKTLSFFSDKNMENISGIDMTESEAIEVLARNLREGKISTASIKKEIFEQNEFMASLWEEGHLLEILEQEYTLSLDEKQKPVCTRKNKIYDKEGNLTGEEEEETFYRSGQNEGDREYVTVRRTYEIIEDKRLQTGEEEFIDAFPASRKKNMQFSKTYFIGGKRFYKRTDRVEQGDVSEEYKDISEIIETGRKLLFARLLEGKTQQLSIRHHRDIFYSSIETEEKEIRSTIYKSIQNPSVLLMRSDLLKGYNTVLPLWVITTASQSEINTQFLFEGTKDSTFIDRFDKTNSYHVFRCTLRDQELKAEIMRESSRVQIHTDEEALKKLRNEPRSHLEYRFSDRVNSIFKVYASAWLGENTDRKGEDIFVAEMIENINYSLLQYLHPDNKVKREGALDKKHTFLPLITTGGIGFETLLGYKFGLDMVFLLWEMLNAIGHTEEKDRFARIRV